MTLVNDQLIPQTFAKPVETVMLIASDTDIVFLVKKHLPRSCSVIHAKEVCEAKKILHSRSLTPVIIEFHENERPDSPRALFLNDPAVQEAIIVSKLDDTENLRFLYAHPSATNVLAKNSPWFEQDLKITLQKKFSASHIWGIKLYLENPTIVEGEKITVYQHDSCMNEINEVAASLETFPGFVNGLQTILNELVMNAVLDGPADEDVRKKRMEDQKNNKPISLDKNEVVLVHYGYDENSFAISVFDSHGTLSMKSVVYYLVRAFMYGENQITLEEGKGAGIGLYLALNCSAQIVFNVKPGCKTEIICLIPRAQRRKGFLSHPKSINFFFD